MKYLQLFIAFLILLPGAARAAAGDMQITEIMYDPAGSDASTNGDRHEWVELWNGGSEAVTIVGGNGVGGWRFNDGENHLFSTASARGSFTLAPGDFLVISSNPDTFLVDYPNFSGNLVKVSFSLGNTAETLSLRIGTSGAPWSEVSYSKNQGGNNNGKTLEWNQNTGLWQESAELGGSPGAFLATSAPAPPAPVEQPAEEPAEPPAPMNPPPPPTEPEQSPPSSASDFSEPSTPPQIQIVPPASPPGMTALLTGDTNAAAESASSPQKASEKGVPLISISNVRTAKLETRVRVRGTVIATPAVSTGQFFYISDDRAGLQVYSSKKDFPELSLGDIVEVTGTVGEANKERRVRISASDAIKIVGSGPVPSAAEVAIANLADALVGRLARLSGAVVARTSTGFTIEDESGEMSVSLGERVLQVAFREGDEVAIVGVLSRGRQGYRFLPRASEDITVVSRSPDAALPTRPNAARPVASVLLGGAAVALGLWGRKDMALRAFRAMHMFFKKK